MQHFSVNFTSFLLLVFQAVGREHFRLASVGGARGFYLSDVPPPLMWAWLSRGPGRLKSKQLAYEYTTATLAGPGTPFAERAVDEAFKCDLLECVICGTFVADRRLVCEDGHCLCYDCRRVSFVTYAAAGAAVLLLDSSGADGRRQWRCCFHSGFAHNTPEYCGKAVPAGCADLVLEEGRCPLPAADLPEQGQLPLVHEVQHLHRVAVLEWESRAAAARAAAVVALRRAPTVAGAVVAAQADDLGEFREKRPERGNSPLARFALAVDQHVAFEATFIEVRIAEFAPTAVEPSETVVDSQAAASSAAAQSRVDELSSDLQLLIHTASAHSTVMCTKRRTTATEFNGKGVQWEGDWLKGKAHIGCGRAMAAFTGCFTVQCAGLNGCGAFVCGFCGETSPGSASGHNHLKTCLLSPRILVGLDPEKQQAELGCSMDDEFYPAFLPSEGNSVGLLATNLRMSAAVAPYRCARVLNQMAPGITPNQWSRMRGSVLFIEKLAAFRLELEPLTSKQSDSAQGLFRVQKLVLNDPPVQAPNHLSALLAVVGQSKLCETCRSQPLGTINTRVLEGLKRGPRGVHDMAGVLRSFYYNSYEPCLQSVLVFLKRDLGLLPLTQLRALGLTKRQFDVYCLQWLLLLPVLELGVDATDDSVKFMRTPTEEDLAHQVDYYHDLQGKDMLLMSSELSSEVGFEGRIPIVDILTLVVGDGVRVCDQDLRSLHPMQVLFGELPVYHTQATFTHTARAKLTGLLTADAAEMRIHAHKFGGENKKVFEEAEVLMVQLCAGSNVDWANPELNF